MELLGLNIYPVKSLAGFSPNKWEVAREGLLFDRKWMLTDKDGNFCTQRKFPRMSNLQATIRDKQLHIRNLSSGKEMTVPDYSSGTNNKAVVRVWKDDTMAHVAPDEINQWFSENLGFQVSLYQQEGNARRKHAVYGTEKIVSFADSQPFLIIGTASLRDLNKRMGAHFTMDRFRPNFIVETEEPYIEDSWNHIQIGDLFLKKTKKCGRCKMVNINPVKGAFDEDVLNFLGTYRKQNNSINFGIRVTWENFEPGKMAEVGQKVIAYK